MLTQLDSTNTTIASIRPVAPVAPTVYYQVQLAHPTGDYFPESTLTETHRDCVINDIAGDVHATAVRRVIAFEIGGRCWDASQDIARDVLEQVIDTYPASDIPYEVRTFLDDILGCNAVQSALLEAAA